MSDNVSVEFEDKEIQDFLSNMEKRLKNVEDGSAKYASIIAATVFKDVINHFQEQAGSDGAWAERKNPYKRIIEEQGFTNILQVTGRLRQGVMPMNFKSEKSKGLFWFNNAKTKSGFPYAFAHNEGGPQLKKREFMWLSEKALDSIAVQTLQFMVDMEL